MVDIRHVIDLPPASRHSLSDHISQRVARRRRRRQKLTRALPTTMQDPIVGDKEAGEAILAGCFLVNGQRYPFITFPEDKNTASREASEAETPAFHISAHQLAPECAEYLHSFRWLRDLASTEIATSDAAVIVQALIDAWLDDHAESRNDPAWRLDICSWRLMILASHEALALPSNGGHYTKAILSHIADIIDHLEQSVDHAPPSKNQLLGWIGIVATALLFSHSAARRTISEAGLKRSLRANFHTDGGIVTRVPSDQLDVVAALAMLTALYAARSEIPPDFIFRNQWRAVAALLTLAHGDGSLASWQGDAAIPAQQVGAIVRASGVPPHRLQNPKQWGYQRLSAGTVQLIADASPPPIDRSLAMGCASTLAFELSDGAQRIIVNCGGAALCAMRQAHDLAQGLRTTAAHSTLVLADSNSSKLRIDGALDRGVTQVEVDRFERSHQNNHEQRLQMSHNGYVDTCGMIHRRTLSLATAPMVALRGKDKIYPAPVPKPKKKKQRATSEANLNKAGALSACLRFHLGAGIAVEINDSEHCALLRTAESDGEKHDWEFYIIAHPIAVEDSLWVDGHGKLHSTKQLAIHTEVPAEGIEIGWILRQVPR